MSLAKLPSSVISKQMFSSSRKKAVSWIIVFGFLGITLLCLLADAKLLNYVFPISALLVGIILYLFYPELYIGFTWWLWFLTPIVRRFVDYRGGFINPSPILLAPFLVTLLTLIACLRSIPKLKQQGGLPFILSCLGVFYGFLIGLIQKSNFVLVAIDFLNWLTPITFGFYLYMNWHIYPSCRQVIQQAFLWCVLLTGSYGIFQYLVAPEWDKFWLSNVIGVGATSFGRPEPLAIRVWSTMNSPGVFGIVMMAGLLLLMSNKSPFFLPATVVGYLSFLLSLVRSAWAAWLVGLLNLFFLLKPKLQMRLILVSLIVSLCVVPITQVEPFSKVIGSRLNTFSDIKQDNSAIERQEIYNTWLPYALENFLGDGIGETLDQYGNIVVFDSALIVTLIRLGWFGTFFYSSGLTILVFKLTQNSQFDADAFANTARAIAICMVCQLPLGVVMLELQGMILWGFLGISLAAQRYYKYQL